MISKSDMVRELVLNGDYKKALHIVRGFRLGIATEDLGKMALAYECLVHSGFYKQLGINADTAVSEGVSILKELYGQGEEIEKSN